MTIALPTLDREDLEGGILARIPWVAYVEWEMLSPSIGIASLRLRWWAWLFPVVAQWIAVQRAHELLAEWTPAGSQFLVRVW